MKSYRQDLTQTAEVYGRLLPNHGRHGTERNTLCTPAPNSCGTVGMFGLHLSIIYISHYSFHFLFHYPYIIPTKPLYIPLRGPIGFPFSFPLSLYSPYILYPNAPTVGSWCWDDPPLLNEGVSQSKCDVSAGTCLPRMDRKLAITKRFVSQMQVTHKAPSTLLFRPPAVLDA